MKTTGRTAFLKMMLAEIGSTPWLSSGAVLLIVLSRMVAIRTVRIASRAISSVGRLTGPPAWAFALCLCLNAACISLLFCYRRLYLSLVARRIEAAAFRKNMALEHSGCGDPRRGLQRMDRQNRILQDGVEALLFDVATHLATVFFSSRTLVRVVETWKVAANFASLCVFFCLQVLAFRHILTLKSDAVGNEELKLLELAGLHRNIRLVRRSGEDDYARVRRTYTNKVGLRHGLLLGLFHFTTALCLVVLHALTLYSGLPVKKNVVLFGSVSALLGANINGLARSLLSLDNLRMGLSDCIEKEDLEEPGEETGLKDGIVMRDVGVFAGDRMVLRGINLCLKRNDVVALVGANGAGKTVFLKLLLGFFRFTGSIAVDGREVGGEPSDGRRCVSGRMRRAIGYCPVSLHLVGNTVRDNTGDGRAGDVAKRYGMHGHLCRLGCSTEVDAIADQRDLQVLNITRAVARESDILLFDEPTNHLDAETSTRMLDEIVRNRDGKLVVVATHRLEELPRFSKIVLFSAGTATAFDTYKDYAARTSIK